MDDRALMAEFMGHDVDPNDMNALLGVMMAVGKYGYSVLIDTKNGYVEIQILGNKVSNAYFDDDTDLPTVLFPLLVEAIKQIKESGNEW